MKVNTSTGIHAILVHPDLEQAPEWVTFAAEDLSGMRRILGCQWVERVTTPIPGVSMWVDEEGALDPEGIHNAHCSAILYPGRIVGPALLTGITPIGEVASLNAQQVAALAGRGITVQPRPSHRADLQWLSEEEIVGLTGRVRRRIAQRDGEVTA
ncbi:DUF3846 domain-containing protein [Arachnia propionica]|uniref:DUF3846 domain-containing protein n=1 Tax=Arachnia propionica TaxID=1750 RepID=A0A3P1T2Z3_9ACTN|nr:DUF3846 domain-containing protein [Arachnia propionica]RRD03196.1 DUF3846 domain-containing protein [Arachnia propionica]